MVTSGVIYHILRFLTIPVDIRNICVLLAPGFSGLTALAMYLLTSEMSPSPSAGLLAAAFMGIAPGYISRSVAGSYDNEAIAIFLLVFTFFLWIKAVKNGSIMWGALTALFYGYMVSAWGGYVFITNLIPLHVFVLLCMGRYSTRIYISYTTWYALGTLASMQIPFVGFLPIRNSDHMSALGRSLLSQVQMAVQELTFCRCLRPASACGLRRVCPQLRSKQAVPETSDRHDLHHLRSRFAWASCSDCDGSDRSLERPILLLVGHWLCQNPHSHHCLSLGTPAHRLASVLLRSELPDLAFPGRCLHVLP